MSKSFPTFSNHFSYILLPLHSFSNNLVCNNSMPLGIQRFNATFTRALQKSLFWVEPAHFVVLTPISLRSSLLLSSYVRLGLPKSLFPVGLPVRILKALLPSSNLVTYTATLIIKSLISRFLHFFVYNQFPIRIMFLIVIVCLYFTFINICVNVWSLS